MGYVMLLKKWIEGKKIKKDKNTKKFRYNKLRFDYDRVFYTKKKDLHSIQRNK